MYMDNNNIEDLKKQLVELQEMIKQKKERQKIATKKYQQSEKGKAARRRAYVKRYKPTGNPVGRPLKA